MKTGDRKMVSIKREGDNSMFVECPLCGALVPQNEIQTWGYCKICRQLVEVFICHRERRRDEVLLQNG